MIEINGMVGGGIHGVMIGTKEEKSGVQNTIQLVACSALRRNLLVSLSEGDKPLGDIRDELNVSSTTAIHALRDLEKGNIVHDLKKNEDTLKELESYFAV